MSFTSSSTRRDLWIAVVGRAVSLLGDEAAVFALTLRLNAHGSAPWAIAGLLVAGLAPLVVLAPVAGRLVDGHDSRTLLVVAGVAQAAACFVLVNVTSIAPTLVLVAVLGCGQAVVGATWQALLPAIVGDEALPRALGLSQAAGQVSIIAAPALAGVLTGRYGARVPLLIDACSFVAMVLAALVVHTRRLPSRSEPADRDNRGGFAILRADPVLLPMTVLLAMFIVLGATVNVVEVFLVRDTLHGSSTWFGTIAALWGVGLVVGSLLAGRLRGPARLTSTLLAAAIVLSIAVGSYSIAPAVGWLAPASVIGGFANGVLNLCSGALIMQRTPTEVRGRISATLSGVTSAALIGSYALGGALAAVLTPREIFLAAGCLGLLAPVVLGRGLLRSLSESDGTAAIGAARPDPTG